MQSTIAVSKINKTVKILIVEDSPFDAQLIENALNTHHSMNEEYVYTHAGSVAETKKMVEKEKFDVIILDLTLPDSDGMETLRKVRAFAENRPIVVMSSLDDEEAALQSVRDGAQDYLIKGQADLRDLHYFIDRAIERERMESELKEAKHEAEEATRLKDKFVSLVMHDLTTSLAVFEGILSVLNDDVQDPLPARQKKFVEMLLGNAENMLLMTNDLLSMSRVNAGSIRPEKRFVDLDILTQQAVSKFMGAARRKKIDIVDETKPGRRVYTDPRLLEVVIKNLLSNAIKYSREGGTVTIKEPDSPRWTLSVQDHGVGMDEDELPHLFKEEIKTVKKGTAGEIGSGLGLPFSQNIIKALGGKLEVKSVKNKGSAFFIILPEVRPNILVVDDDQLARNIAKTALMTLDVDVVEAANGEEAIEKIRRDVFHLITIDINMPGMNGFKLLKLLKSHPTAQYIPVIMVTSDKDADTRHKAYELGANDFVSKPIQKEDYLPRIRHLLSGETIFAKDFLDMDE